MIENEKSSSIHMLMYATPALRRSRPVLGLTVLMSSAVFGLLGAFILLWGLAPVIMSILHMQVHRDRDLTHDVCGIVMSLPTGMFCLYVAFCLCRASFSLIIGRNSSHGHAAKT